MTARLTLELEHKTKQGFAELIRSYEELMQSGEELTGVFQDLNQELDAIRNLQSQQSKLESDRARADAEARRRAEEIARARAGLDEQLNSQQIALIAQQKDAENKRFEDLRSRKLVSADDERLHAARIRELTEAQHGLILQQIDEQIAAATNDHDRQLLQIKRERESRQLSHDERLKANAREMAADDVKSRQQLDREAKLRDAIKGTGSAAAAAGAAANGGSPSGSPLQQFQNAIPQQDVLEAIIKQRQEQALARQGPGLSAGKQRQIERQVRSDTMRDARTGPRRDVAAEKAAKKKLQQRQQDERRAARKRGDSGADMRDLNKTQAKERRALQGAIQGGQFQKGGISAEEVAQAKGQTTDDSLGIAEAAGALSKEQAANLRAANNAHQAEQQEIVKATQDIQDLTAQLDQMTKMFEQTNQNQRQQRQRAGHGVL